MHPPELPGFTATTSLSAISTGLACPSREPSWRRTSTGETSLVASDVLRCMPMPLPRRNWKVPASFSSFPAAAFPQFGDGRLPHYSYRGLLSIHSRFGLQLRQVASSDPCTGDSGSFVTSTTPPVATGWNDPCRTGLAPAKHQTPFQGVPRLRKSTARPAQLPPLSPLEEDRGEGLGTPSCAGNRSRRPWRDKLLIRGL